jgi:hypothetical protein
MKRHKPSAHSGPFLMSDHAYAKGIRRDAKRLGLAVVGMKAQARRIKRRVKKGC